MPDSRSARTCSGRIGPWPGEVALAVNTLHRAVPVPSSGRRVGVKLPENGVDAHQLGAYRLGEFPGVRRLECHVEPGGNRLFQRASHPLEVGVAGFQGFPRVHVFTCGRSGHLNALNTPPFSRSGGAKCRM
jgi:hypothetical protein